MRVGLGNKRLLVRAKYWVWGEMTQARETKKFLVSGKAWVLWRKGDYDTRRLGLKRNLVGRSQ